MKNKPDTSHWKKYIAIQMKRNNMRHFLFVIFLVSLIIAAGCINDNESSRVTPPPTTVVPTLIIIDTTIPTTVPTPTLTLISENQTIEDIPEPIPTAEMNISKITFSQYSDSDFSLDYPSAWEIKKTTFDPINNEINDRDIFKQPARKIEFVGKDNKTKLVAITYDFTSPGAFILNRNQEWARNAVTAQFPDVNGATAVINYNYFKDDRKNMVATFDVVLPKISEWYPYSYSEKVIVTLRHEYIFKLIAERGNIEEYKDLKEAIFASIVTKDMTV